MKRILLTRLVAAALIVGAVFLTYWPSLSGDFIWDDDQHLVEDPFLAASDGLYRIWFAPERYVWNYWPATRSTFWLERRVWDLDPRGYRVVNLVLHILNALFLWRVLVALKIPGAWLAALIFALHPVNVETAAWITQRKNTLAMFFCLLSLKWYLGFEEAGDKPRYIASLAAFLLALLSKSAVVFLPAVLLSLALWRGRPAGKTALRRLTPYFLLALAAGLVSIWFERNYIGSAGKEFGIPLLERLILAGRTYWFYLGKALWPDPVIFIYPRWVLEPSFLLAWLPLLGLAVIPVLFLRNRRRPSGGIFFALTCFALALFPVLGFFNIYFTRYSFVADHWQYFALPAPLALVVALTVLAARKISSVLAPDLRRWFRVGAVALTVIVVISLAGLSRTYSRAFLGLKPLWRDTIAKNPEAWMARINLGILLMDEEDFPEAVDQFGAAIRLYPQDPQTTALRSRGICYGNLGDLDAALTDFNRALMVNSVNPDVYYHRGNLYRDRGEMLAALRDWNRALTINPGLVDAYLNRGVARYMRGQPEEARADFERVIELKPDYAEAHYNLAIVLESLGKDEAALTALDRAIELKPAKEDFRARRDQLRDR